MCRGAPTEERNALRAFGLGFESLARYHEPLAKCLTRVTCDILNHMKTCLNCLAEFPIHVVIDGKKRHLGKRSYCLKCSPFGSNNRRKLHEPSKRDTHIICRLCGELLARTGNFCYTCRSRIRRYRVKATAVHHLGGKCQRCGWDKDIAALDFHHPNDDKEIAIADATNGSWDVLVKELKKCELLCSNCHRIEHRGVRDEKFFAIVEEYSGRMLKW
jgi:RNase P subunit RPR2